MNLSDPNMKSVPTIRPKYIFLAGWFLTSIFILLNCHYDWNVLDASGVVSIESTEKPLRKIIMIVTFMRSGSSFLGEFFNLHPGIFFRVTWIQNLCLTLTLKLLFDYPF